MKTDELLRLLQAVESGKLAPEAALARLKHLPFEDIGFAKVDHHRALRQGYAEVIFGKGKTPAQIAQIARSMFNKKDSRHNILITRADKEIFTAVKRVSRAAVFHPLSGVITIQRTKELTGKGTILIVSAGTRHI